MNVFSKIKTQVIEVDRKLVPGIEWDSVQEAQRQTGILDLEQKIADGQYTVWPEQRCYIMTMSTFRALYGEFTTNDAEVEDEY